MTAMPDPADERQLYLRLASELGALLEAASTFGQASAEWEALADQLRERLGGVYAPISPRIPHDLEHYLIDSDIRQRDSGYAASQESAMRAHMASWLAGTP